MKKKIIKRIFIGIIALAVIAVGGAALFYYSVKAGAFGPIPGDEDLLKIQNATATVVFSADEQPIGRIFAENRTNARFEEFSQNLIDALIATEDARFFEHEGVDQRSLMRVLFKTLLLGDESSGGGSTITQQLGKNLYGRKDFGFLSLPVNKVKEMILAQRLEELYSKEEVLELYLNTVPFSENVYGIETASQRFFNKQPEELQPEESAVLVGMLKANTYYNPRLHPDNALQRRNTVLLQMYRYGYLDEAAKDSLQNLPLELDYRNSERDAPADYFMVRVKQKAQELLQEAGLGENMPDLEMDGLRIHTTLNYKLQESAKAALSEHLSVLQKMFDRYALDGDLWGTHPQLYQNSLENSRSYQNLKERKLSEDSLQYYLTNEHPVSVYHPAGDTVMEMSIRDSVAYYLKLLKAGFLAMNPEDGAILAWVGGLDQQLMPYDHVLARRQAASTFKPFVYSTALKEGMEPCDYISNERRLYEEYEDWAPRNYNNEYGGYYSMAGALKKSINVAAAQTIFEVGVDNVLGTAYDMGIESRLPDDPSVALGTGSVSLYEMVRAYAAFANGGQRVEPYMITKIENAEGKVLYEAKSAEKEQVLEPEIAQLMNEMLRGVVNEGTGIKLRRQYGVEMDLAGKTGTAQDYSDGWFIGYNPAIVAGAWVGASSPQLHFKTGNLGSGSAMALPIFAGVFKDIERSPELEHYRGSQFDSLPADLQQKLDCEDFREKNLMDSFRNIFDSKEGEKVDKEGKKKKGFFKRLFGGGKND